MSVKSEKTKKLEICPIKQGGCGNTDSDWNCGCKVDDKGKLYQPEICPIEKGGCGNMDSSWCCGCSLDYLVDINPIDHPEIYTALYFHNLKTGKESCLRGYRYGSGAVCTSVCDDIRLCIEDRKNSIQLIGRILKEERIRKETKLETGYYKLKRVVSGSCKSSTRGLNINIGLDINSGGYEVFDSTVFEYDGASFHIVPDKVALKIMLGILGGD